MHSVDIGIGSHDNLVVTQRVETVLYVEGCGDDVENWCIAVGDMADYVVQTQRGEYITKEEALHIFSGWCKKRWFLPSAFKEKQNLEKITGLYVPFWVADCNVHADLNAIGKQVKTWRSGDYRYTNTKEFAVRRMGQVGLDGIPADGSRGFS